MIQKVRKSALIVLLFTLLSSCNQNMSSGNGEPLANAPKPVANVNPRPLAQPGSDIQTTTQVPPFVKAFFMHQYVEALYSTPKNFNPNPNWASPLADPVNGR